MAGAGQGGGGVGGDFRAGGLVFGVRHRRLQAGAGFDGDGEAETHEFLHGVDRGGDAGFGGVPFLQHR